MVSANEGASTLGSTIGLIVDTAPQTGLSADQLLLKHVYRHCKQIDNY
jgi:hypothetical protein